MESPIRLTSWTPINLPGKFSDFHCISQGVPQQSSFYLAMGAAYISCLLRIRKELNLSKYALDAFYKYTTLSDRYININPELHGKYREMISILLNEKSNLSLQWIINYMQNNEYRGAEAMEFGMRCLFASCMKFWKSEQESILRNDEFLIEDKAFYLINFANFMKIHILIIKREEHDYFERLNFKTGPLVCLFYENKSYSVIYHAEMEIFLDEQRSRLLNLARFPFYHCPASAEKIEVTYEIPEATSQTEGTYNEFSNDTHPY